MKKRNFFFNDGIFLKNSIGIEIGIFKGHFAERVINRISPKMYYMIDPWKYVKGWDKYKYKNRKLLGQEDMDWMYEDICKRFDKPNVKIYRDYSQNVVNEFKDLYFDFVYVDGHHSYESVLQDLTLYYPKVKVGGILAGDDWIIKGQDRVKRAVIDFSKEINLKFKVKENQYWFQKI